MSGINHVEYKILDRWSRKKAEARLQCDRGFAQAVDAYQSVPVTWVFFFTCKYANMQYSAFGVLMMMFVKHFASNRVAEVVQAGIIRKIGRNTEQEIQC